MSKIRQAKKIWRIIIKVFSITFFTVAMLVLVAAIFLAIGDQRRTAIFGFSFFVVETDSMEPRLMVGEFIVVRTTDIADLEIDDMITFWQGGVPVTHAIVAIEQDRVIARGDKAPPHITETVYHDDIIGRVIFQSIPIGSIVLFFTSWQGLIFLIFIPLIILLIYEAWRIKLKIKNKREASVELPKSGEN